MNSKFFRKHAAIAAAAVMSLSCMASVVNSPAYIPTATTTITAFAADSVNITSSVGYAEGMYVTWSSVSGAEGYNVYVDGVQIDSMLIRQYASYMRADAVGIKAGSHTMKVVPVISGKEDTSKAAEAKADVYAHDRSGYAFADGHMPGAYKADGTLKDNAIVVYVTNENKDTVTVALNAEGKGNVDCVGFQNIVTAYKKGKETRPISIRLIGNIEDPANMPKGDIMVDTVTSAGMTIEGIGNDATANGWGIVLKNCVDVEVRNVGTMNCNSDEGDNIGLQQGDSYCWVHNCDFFYGDAGSDKDQVKGDGALDTKKSHHITHSYNHFYDNGKCNLQGANASDTSNYITYHHNWYDHSDSRHPRVRKATVHVYNNYYDGNAKYGIGSTTDSDIFAENNYFRNCSKPMMIANQGTDAAGEGTFSGEVGGMIKAYGNVFDGGTYVPYSKNNTQFDFYDAKSRDEKVPSSVKTVDGAGYNNFDTESGFYSYKVDKAEDIPSIVTSKAGRVDGGDFKWQFDNSVDDASYDVNQALKSALVAYKDSIVAIGSGFTNTSSTSPTNTTTTASKSNTQNTTTTTSKPNTSTVAPTGIKVEYSGGWNEMAYMGISGIKDADVTGVSYSGASSGSLKGEDLEYLVRDVDGGVRVDLLGLKAGTYTITVTTSKGEVKQSGIVVGQQDRSGYAHYNYSDGVGAYNDNGELKANAKVIYVTEENKNTVSVTSKDGTTVKGIGNILNSVAQDVGGGKNANGGTANTNQDIIKKLAKDGTPLVIRIVGNVSTPEGVTVFDSVDMGGSKGDNGGMARMRSGKNITIEGVGADATVNGWGFHFMSESSAPELGKSFEVRNIAFRNVPEDCIGMEGVQEGSSLTASVERCWIHNCEFYVPKIANPAESDKAEGDGACDFKRGQYFTNSYCYYEGYHKTNLVGASDSNLQFNISFHHNYWKNCESRGPLARQANIHLYNNIFDGQSSYCASARANSFLFSEYNAYVNECKDPVLLKSGGVFKSYNDAYISLKKGAKNEGTIVTDKGQTITSSCQKANFDTDSKLSYIPSGNYKLIEATGEALYTALTAEFEAYGGCMDNTKISGSGSTTTTPQQTTTTSSTAKPSGSTTTTTTNGGTVVAGGYVHDFTANGTKSDFYTITGNLSTSKGTVNYNGLTLKQCLKMESATNITFNAPSAGKITLVFVEPAATIKVDGTKYTSAGDGTITVDLKAGAHTITKADTANLFYMVYSEEGSNIGATTTQNPGKDIIYGDANGDGRVSVSDAVLIMQCLSNPNEFQMNAEQADAADVYSRGDGVTTMDALAIQKIDIGLIDTLPESYME
ncbi:MAG: dockerin type I domain-containing protein [Muribaculaceae bacterium]|nr:dockerin type I domain-containing protein [Alistipes senegalensis]MCM1473806.1 dockerin type I domain-containing protein [Muribaculaceae bacterium]